MRARAAPSPTRLLFFEQDLVSHAYRYVCELDVDSRWSLIREQGRKAARSAGVCGVFARNADEARGGAAICRVRQVVVVGLTYTDLYFAFPLCVFPSQQPVSSMSNAAQQTKHHHHRSRRCRRRRRKVPDLAPSTPAGPPLPNLLPFFLAAAIAFFGYIDSNTVFISYFGSLTDRNILIA